MEIKPMNSRVILKELKDKNEKGGILIPDKKQEEKIFEVVENGGIDEIKKGEKVIIDEFAGKGRLINGEELYFVEISDIIAIIKE